MERKSGFREALYFQKSLFIAPPLASLLRSIIGSYQSSSIAQTKWPQRMNRPIIAPFQQLFTEFRPSFPQEVESRPWPSVARGLLARNLEMTMALGKWRRDKNGKRCPSLSPSISYPPSLSLSFPPSLSLSFAKVFVLSRVNGTRGTGIRATSRGKGNFSPPHLDREYESPTEHLPLGPAKRRNERRCL